ncbi:hypothetical protein GQ42DRAFT_111090, partial [Ramicandelaber brevisporus]
HIRLSTRVDYEQNICKDFKLTGYCGYGDSCTFLHDRSTLKVNNKVNPEWESIKQTHRQARNIEVKSKETKAAAKAEIVSPECSICNNSYEFPVALECGHVFCEECALANHRKTGKCFVCGKKSQGTFVDASELVK